MHSFILNRQIRLFAAGKLGREKMEEIERGKETGRRSVFGDENVDFALGGLRGDSCFGFCIRYQVDGDLRVRVCMDRMHSDGEIVIYLVCS